MPVTTVTNGPSSPTLTMSVPASASQGVAISAGSIGATLAGSSGATTGSTITIYYKATATQPVSGCGGAGWTTLGTASPTGDGTWTRQVATRRTLRPNCGGTRRSAAMRTTTRQRARAVPAWRRPPSGSRLRPCRSRAPASGTANTLITAASITATLSSSIGSNPAAINVYVYGPNATAPTTAPVPVGHRSAPRSTPPEAARITRVPVTRRRVAAPTTGTPRMRATRTTARPPPRAASVTPRRWSGPDTYSFTSDRHEDRRNTVQRDHHGQPLAAEPTRATPVSSA